MNADVVKLNATEAHVIETLFGVPHAARWLVESMDIEVAALTLGKGGVEIHTPGSQFAVPAHPLELTGEAADAVGAGDAFTATLSLHLAHGASLKTAACAATRYASAIASRAGASPRLPQEILTACRPEPQPNDNREDP